MSGLERDIIGGFNSMIEQQKKAEGEALISTVLFDNVSEVLHCLCWGHWRTKRAIISKIMKKEDSRNQALIDWGQIVPAFVRLWNKPNQSFKLFRLILLQCWLHILHRMGLFCCWWLFWLVRWDCRLRRSGCWVRCRIWNIQFRTGCMGDFWEKKILSKKIRSRTLDSPPLSCFLVIRYGR